MKVLFVHQRLGDLGGAESTIRRLGEGLSQRGLELGFLYAELTGKGHERFEEHFPRRWCWGQGQLDAALGWGADVVFVHKLDDAAVLERLVGSGQRLVRMVHDHDIYCQRRHRYLPWNRSICTRPAGWACGALCGVVRNESGPVPLRVAWPGQKLRELELCRRFDHHITVSDYLKRELILNGFEEDHITTLWPAVRDVPFSRCTNYREPRVVYAGQLLRGKGVDVLVEALARLETPGWRCSIVGDGSFREPIERLVSSLGLRDRVELHGWIPQEDLHTLLGSARVAVVPSVWPEPLGAVGIEMFRHGLPVVGFEVGGIPEWLKDGVNGYLAPVLDRRALADRIDRLLASPALAERLGSHGRELAATWCREEEHFDRLIALLGGRFQEDAPPPLTERPALV